MDRNHGVRPLKPVGTNPDSGVKAADRALDKGSVSELANEIAERIETGVRERFAYVVQTKQHADHNTVAGREYVEAYVAFVHYVKHAHELIGRSANLDASENASHTAQHGCTGE